MTYIRVSHRPFLMLSTHFFIGICLYISNYFSISSVYRSKKLVSSSYVLRYVRLLLKRDCGRCVPPNGDTRNATQLSICFLVPFDLFCIIFFWLHNADFSFSYLKLSPDLWQYWYCFIFTRFTPYLGFAQRHCFVSCDVASAIQIWYSVRTFGKLFFGIFAFYSVKIQRNRDAF